MGNVNANRRTSSCGRIAMMAGLAALATACASPPPPFAELPRLGVKTQITARNLCGLGVSPAIGIANAPEATAQYRVRLTNTSVLFHEPWQTTAEATKGGFPEGALAGYQPPCVGDLQISSFYRYQMYRLEVLALDTQSRPLAYGATTFLVRSIPATLERERAAARRGTQQPPSDLPSDGLAVDPADADTVGRFVSPSLVPQIMGPMYQP